MGCRIKVATGAEIVAGWPVGGLPEVHRVSRLAALLRLLGVESGAGEIAVEYARCDRVGDQGGCRARADPVLAALGVVGRKTDRPRDELGLKDWRHRLSAARQSRQNPRELGRVDGGKLR